MDSWDQETLQRIDSHVGQRIRQRRTQLNLSQQKLAGAIGVTYQHLQKYENGDDRVSGSRLYALSQIFGVPVAYFFSDFDRKDDFGNS